MSETDDRQVLCGANAYEQKYFFNKDRYGNLPKAIQEELHILCVLFTEEVGGIFTIVFEEDGGVSMDTMAADEDYLYDEVSAGLLVAKVRSKRKELFEALSLYYRSFILKEDITKNLEEN